MELDDMCGWFIHSCDEFDKAFDNCEYRNNTITITHKYEGISVTTMYHSRVTCDIFVLTNEFVLK